MNKKIIIIITIIITIIIIGLIAKWAIYKYIGTPEEWQKAQEMKIKAEEAKKSYEKYKENLEENNKKINEIKNYYDSFLTY